MPGGGPARPPRGAGSSGPATTAGWSGTGRTPRTGSRPGGTRSAAGGSRRSSRARRHFRRRAGSGPRRPAPELLRLRGHATARHDQLPHDREFRQAGRQQNQGVVNHDSAPGWTIDHRPCRTTPARGSCSAATTRLSYDCLADNQQYGFNAYSTPARRTWYSTTTRSLATTPTTGRSRTRLRLHRRRQVLGRQRRRRHRQLGARQPQRRACGRTPTTAASTSGQLHLGQL